MPKNFAAILTLMTRTASNDTTGSGDQPLFEAPGCKGTLAWLDGETRHEAEFEFDLRVGPTGALSLKFHECPLTKDNSWILKAATSKELSLPQLQLDGRTNDGRLLTSDSVFLLSHGTKSTPTFANLHISASAISVRLQTPLSQSNPSTHWQIQYAIAGLRCFRQVQFEMPFGLVTIVGDHKNQDPKQLCGLVCVDKNLDSAQDPDTWADQMDTYMNRVLDVLSFADAHFLRAGYKQLCRGPDMLWIDFYGEQTANGPYQPPLRFVDFDATIPNIVRVYDDEALLQRTSLNLALQWHLMASSYNEAQYLAQMTAIEHLIEAYRMSGDSTMSKTEFRRSPLRTKLSAMLDAYGVPLDGLDGRLKALIDVRNDIVHRGVASPNDPDRHLADHLAAAQELFRRIFLSLVGYTGTYTSYHGSIHDRTLQGPVKTAAP